MTAAGPLRRDRGKLANWVRAHPIGAFLIWFFVVGWPIAFVPGVAKSALGVELPLEPFIIAATWLGLLLPAVAVTWTVDGVAGVRELGRRVLTVRAAVGWCALALLVVPLVGLLLATILVGPPPAAFPTLVSAFVGGLLVQTAIGFLTVNLWEEVAWMGFVQARLQARHGAILAAAITAVLFALQHVPVVIDNGPAILIILPIFALVAVPFRGLVAWIYNRTGSLLLVGLLHAAGDATARGGYNDGFLARLYDTSDINLLPQLAELVVGIVIIAATRARLGAPARAAKAAQAGPDLAGSPT